MSYGHLRPVSAPLNSRTGGRTEHPGMREQDLMCGKTLQKSHIEGTSGSIILCPKVHLQTCQMTKWELKQVRWVGVVYLDKIVRGIPLQVGINVTLHSLQQATEAEAHQERVVGVALFHDGGQLGAQALSEKRQVSRKRHDHHWCNAEH